MSHLFTPTKVGAYSLSHRVVLAPMTRLRTIQPGDIPSPMMADFYGQRASEGGLEIVEGVSISITARSYLGAASFYHDGQVEGWKADRQCRSRKGRPRIHATDSWRTSKPRRNDRRRRSRCALRRAVRRRRVDQGRLRAGLTAPRARDRRDSRASSRNSASRRNARSMPASTASSCMARTAISSTSSSRTAPTSAPTPTAARSKTASASCAKRSKR